MRRGTLSRRGFVERSLGALVASGLPLWSAREVIAGYRELEAGQRKIGPNDRIVMGAIGTGGRGTDILREAKERGAQFVAVCDVDKKHRERAAKEVGGDCKTYNDFRELLDRKDIDAVTIGTPDHWHALIAIAAMKAGKDIYCEKPLTLTVAEGQAMVKVARETKPIFQVGTQQRSDARFRLACEIVRSGRLGKIRWVETRIGENPQGGPFPVVPVPEGLDWDFWLGQAPKVDYVKERCHETFRWWKEYSGGKLTDWGAHHNDIAQWALGTELSGPTAVEAEGDEPDRRPNCYNHPKNFKVTYTYPNGTKLVCRGDGENGVLFVGEHGSLFVDRGKLRLETGDPGLLREPLPKDTQRLYKSDDHMRNFLDCVRDRQPPICPVEIGHRSVSVCHIGNIALALRRPLKWNPDQERFEGDDEANKMLSREMRAPWKLEV
jgi:predicted dehydrogenase